jgi:hypothetical protein
MKTRTALALTAALAAGPMIVPAEAHADSFQHSAAASEAASETIANLAAAGIETVAGAVALPLAVVGGASMLAGESARAGGEVLAGAGTAMTDAAAEVLEETWGAPLSVDDRVVVNPAPAPTVPYAPLQAARR